MAGKKARHEVHHAIAGPRWNVLSVTAFALLGLFVLIVLTLILADVSYLHRKLPAGGFWKVLTSREVVASIRLSLITSLVTLMLVMLFAVPIGYALSRYRFPGHVIANTIVDVPIVLPPVVIGVSLLAFFGTPLGGLIKKGLRYGNWSLTSAIGIVLCQFLVSVSYAIRSNKAAFDSVDHRLEQVALSLGCTPWQAFWRVTMPLARNGLLAGSIMAWARAIGVFGPLMVFVGTSERVLVMPTTIWLELSVGNIAVSLSVAIVMLVLACAALVVVHWLAPGRKWN